MVTNVLLDAKGRVGFVAGAAGGIGAAVVEILLQAGARVAGTARKFDRLSSKTDFFLPITAELVSEESVIAALAQTRDAFGRIDYVINMAGIVGKGPLHEMLLDDWNHVLEVNLSSCFLIAKHGHAHLKKTQGTLILCSSTNGINGGSFLSGPAYASSKAAIINLNCYLAKEWAPDGIRVNCVAPGPVATPLLDRLSEGEHSDLKDRLPLGRYASSKEVAKAVAFLCSDGAATMTGTITNISSGLVLD